MAPAATLVPQPNRKSNFDRRLHRARDLRELARVLPAGYGVYISGPGAVWPKGWPKAAMRLRILRLKEGKLRRGARVCDWLCKAGGKTWLRFYGFVLDTYEEKYGLFPACVYERSRAGNLVRYSPRALLLVDKTGGIDLKLP